MSDVSIIYKGSTIAELSETGNKTLQTSGKYCEGDITVQYTKTQAESGGTDVNCKVFTAEVATKISGAWHVMVAADTDIAAHINDETFGVAWNCLSPIQAAISTRGGVYTNAPMAWNASDGSVNIYGYYIRTSSTGLGANARLTNLPTVKTTAQGTCFVDTDGSISFYGSSAYPILAGTYQVMVWW